MSTDLGQTHTHHVFGSASCYVLKAFRKDMLRFLKAVMYSTVTGTTEGEGPRERPIRGFYTGPITYLVHYHLDTLYVFKAPYQRSVTVSWYCYVCYVFTGNEVSSDSSHWLGHHVPSVVVHI